MVARRRGGSSYRTRVLMKDRHDRVPGSKINCEKTEIQRYPAPRTRRNSITTPVVIIIVTQACTVYSITRVNGVREPPGGDVFFFPSRLPIGARHVPKTFRLIRSSNARCGRVLTMVVCTVRPLGRKG
jgi:hypothetical protein